MSLSARRAWIEIDSDVNSASGTLVALRKESVDRNNRPNSQKDINRRSLSARRAWIEISTVIVILRKRNTSLSARRAWIEIYLLAGLCTRLGLSLSARRAWIEISWVPCWALYSSVALRKESVDRNQPSVHMLCGLCASLSARRAWIEIAAARP